MASAVLKANKLFVYVIFLFLCQHSHKIRAADGLTSAKPAYRTHSFEFDAMFDIFKNFKCIGGTRIFVPCTDVLAFGHFSLSTLSTRALNIEPFTGMAKLR